MNIIDCKQRSPEWYAARCGKVTASGFSAVMAKGKGLTRKKYMYKLLAERISGQSIIEEFTSKSIQRGIDMEDQARANYELFKCVDVRQVGFIAYGVGPIGASPDGLIDTDGGIEIKCPDSHTHVEYLLNGFPSNYRAQVQGNMWVCERDWWDFVSYDDRVKNKELFITRVFRDLKYLEELVMEVLRFTDELSELEYRLRNGTAQQLEDSIKAIEA